jgi:hypothetical protein
MTLQKSILSMAVITVLSNTNALSEVELTGKITHESAVFGNSGTVTGDTKAHKSGGLFKSETNVRLYIDGDMGEDSAFHLEAQGLFDAKNSNDHQDDYTQKEILREAYVDTNIKDWSIRAGKQQVVWGTADGIKLLDMINPTDYSEMAQNQMEDSRVPVWMINAEKDLESGANIQLILSQPRENVFAGLNRRIDTSIRQNNTVTLADETTNNSQNQGSAFILKGVDSITGKENGFLNGVPDLAGMAARFSAGFGGATNLFGGGQNTTVGEYAGNAANAGFPAGFNGDGAQIIKGIAGANYDFNLSDSANAAEWNANIANPNSMFEYMDRTMFSTFDAFNNAGSQYVFDMPKNTETDLAFRLKNTTENGLNYSLNYAYNYDKNPVIDLNWYNTSGEKLKVVYGIKNADDSSVLSIKDAAGNFYGGGGQGSTNGVAVLRFTQKLKRAQNIGGSLDYGLDTESFGAIVLRGEALYQKGVYSPVFNRGKLAIGDLVGALKMTKGDRFKYVLGADFTFLKNMMVSAQFIQDRNLDFIDKNTDWDGTTCTAADGVNCGVYTADFATMHMSNGFQKAEKNKEFYSLFISKPFGSSDEHRINNILMFEENGGKWNRLDVEYSINDDIIATAEWNKYFGDENTQFGQLKSSSNVQLGLKYSF